MLNQEIESADRVVQSKRQEKISAQQNLQMFQDEIEALKSEAIASATSLDRTKNVLEVTKSEVIEKSTKFNLLRAKYEKVKLQLQEESKVTASKEQLTQVVEGRLKEKQNDLKFAEHNVKNMKGKMFKDSQILSQLRQKESNLISEIKSTQVMSCFVFHKKKCSGLCVS